MQVGEAFDVQHVHFVDEQHSGDEFGDALIDVLIHHFVNLTAEFI